MWSAPARAKISAFFNFVRVADGSLSGGGSSAGTVTVTALTDGEVTATLSYDATSSTTMKHYALNGDVTLLRCP